jgi:CBS domain containing-hemolysin-like protein
MKVLLIIIFLVMTGFFAGSETAFLSFDSYMVEVWRKHKKPGYKIVRRFMERPERYITVTLVGTNICNIAYSSIATIYLLDKGLSNGAVLVLLPFVMLVVGEIIPKALFLQMANRIVLRISQILAVFQVLLFPFIRVMQWFVVQISRMLGIKVQREASFFTVPDLKALIHEAEAIGVVDKGKRELIQRVLTLQETRVRDIMTPRTEIVAVEVGDEVSEVRRVISESGYSRLPVYEKDLDHVLGVIRAKDFFESTKTLAERYHLIRVVPESVSIFSLLREMRRGGNDFAMVVDEHGGTAGLVTLEDILEELVGSIEDEHDTEEKPFRQVVPGTILASGRAEIDEINEEMGDIIPRGDYVTVAGWVLERLGRIPRTGETEKIDHCTVKILRASKNRIYTLLIRIREEPASQETRKRT